MAAPATPLTSAWDELVGRPSSQVMMFQMMAPDSPASTTYTSRNSWRTRSLPMVLATLVPKRNAATKLKNAAQITAVAGERTRVETMVAMELAASWKPLRKSNTSAAPMMKKMKRRKAVVGVPPLGAVPLARNT